MLPNHREESIQSNRAGLHETAEENGITERFSNEFLTSPRGHEGRNATDESPYHVATTQVNGDSGRDKLRGGYSNETTEDGLSHLVTTHVQTEQGRVAATPISAAATDRISATGCNPATS